MPDSPSQLPSFTYWPTFPFEGDLRVKRLLDPVPVEPPRHGDNPAECRACRAPDEAYIWVSDRWRVRSLDRPTGLPAVLILESRSHLDLGDLPNMLAAELGVMTVRLERAIRSLDGVARVHVNRWGDGAAHLHVWFLARPYGRLQLQGTFLALWDDILPAIPEDQWRENLAMVAAWLAEFGGRPLAEPPRINWTAPTRLTEDPRTAGSGLDAFDDLGTDEAALPEPASSVTARDSGTPADATSNKASGQTTSSDQATSVIQPAAGKASAAAEDSQGGTSPDRSHTTKPASTPAAPDVTSPAPGGAETSSGSVAEGTDSGASRGANPLSHGEDRG